MNLQNHLQLAGAAQLGIAAVNFLLPALLDYRGNLAKVSPIIRQIFLVHAAYIVLVLTAFGTMSLWFANDLAGGSRLGTFLSGFLALFWLLRVVVQLCYDPETKRRYRLANGIFTLVILYLGLVYLAATLHRP